MNFCDFGSILSAFVRFKGLEWFGWLDRWVFLLAHHSETVSFVVPELPFVDLVLGGGELPLPLDHVVNPLAFIRIAIRPSDLAYTKKH